jgi:hypothetical protein
MSGDELPPVVTKAHRPLTLGTRGIYVLKLSYWVAHFRLVQVINVNSSACPRNAYYGLKIRLVHDGSSRAERIMGRF